MGARKCKNWLASYLRYTEASEAPDRFHFWSGVAAIAGALRKKVWLDMGLFEWTPNFFVLLVAPAGIVSKSTTATLAMDILSEVAGITFGPSSVTWQALIDSFLESFLKWDPDPNFEARILEGKGLEMSCITVAASEFGTFFDPQNRELVDVLVDLYDGRKAGFVRRTVGTGKKTVRSPWLNLIACTTPAWISEHLSNHFTGGGFSSRCIFVWADVKRRLVAYPFLEMEKFNKALRKDLFEDLQAMANLFGPFTLSGEAIKYGTELYEMAFKSPNPGVMSDLIMGWMARRQTHLHKLAMVLSAAESDAMIIEEKHLRKAHACLEQIEPDLPIIFKWGAKEATAQIAASVLDVLKKAKRMGRDDLYRAFWKTTSYQTFDEALTGLVNAGLVRLLNEGSQSVIEINETLVNNVVRQFVADPTAEENKAERG